MAETWKEGHIWARKARFHNCNNQSRKISGYMGLSGLHMKNTQTYLKFMFRMLFPILLVVGTGILLYDRIPVNSISSPTIAMTSPWTYDVFLSFRGPDVRKSFVDHLYNALTNAGIHVFLDSHQRNKGKHMITTIKHAIESSRIKIPIFSPGYADSVWCLEEILVIAQQKQGTTIPLFYKVSPSHVSEPEQPGSPFSQAFQHYQSRKEIDEWKGALYEVCCLSGWSLDDTNGYEAELVKLVVQRVRELCKNEGAEAI